MRFSAVGLLLVLIVAWLAGAQSSTRPMPPGVREGEDKINNEAMEPPKALVPRRVDPAQLKSEAAELQTLANAMPGEVDQVTKGMLPKDMTENLKKIEKLAKHIRSEVTP